MLKAFTAEFYKGLPDCKNQPLLLAVSGGVDSVVLTWLCKRLELNIALAHCNFKLRDIESDQDEKFVRDLAQHLGLSVFVEHFDTYTYAQKTKQSIQVAARELRYTWIEKLLKATNSYRILTAHHADDNLETVLINLARGTGLEGLTGIPANNGDIYRPLLNFSKDEIIKFAIKNKLDWREDSSNLLPKYLRNSLRIQVIPEYKNAQPNVINGLKTTINNLNDTNNLFKELLINNIDACVISASINKTVYRISSILDFKHYTTLVYYIFNPFGFTAFDDIVGLLHAQTGKYVVSKSHHLQKHQETLVLTPLEQKKEFTSSLLTSKDKVDTPIGILKCETVSKIETTESKSAFLDRDAVKFPLEIRQWKKGDFFYPLGLNGSKKLSKFFKDNKFTLQEKEAQLLVLSEQKIVWVVNQRLDNRFKVTPDTKHILKLSIS